MKKQESKIWTVIKSSEQAIYAPKSYIMKTVLLLITVFFSSLALSSCTNDEGDNDLDFITPNEEEENALLTETGSQDTSEQ